MLKNGIDLRLLIDEATAPIAAFAWLDVAVSAVVILVLAIKQITGGQSRFWLVVVGTCGVGSLWGCRSIFTWMRNPPDID